MTAYYNEFDPKAAAWLRELIRQGLIAPGDVDERSIEDVRPDELRVYTQCHFFAGIGVWSYALRGAGWVDDRPVWTGSCPCQPFSAAGKGSGFADERHLWPHFHHLIRECGPSVVLGEQVASKDGLGWFDLVQADLEGSGYACGAVDTCAAGFGAPHIRQRLYWCAERLDDAAGARHVWPLERAEGTARDETRLRVSGAGRGTGLLEHPEGYGRLERRAEPSGRGLAGGCGTGGLGDDDDAGLEGQRHGYQAAGGRVGAAGPVAEAGELGGLADNNGNGQSERLRGRPEQPQRDLEHGGGAGGLADAAEFGRERGRPSAAGDEPGEVERSARLRATAAGQPATGPTNGFWADADWLFCRDGKWRPVEPCTFPLADRPAGRVGRLRGYGNAIVAPAAQAFVEAYLESINDRHLRVEGIFG